MRLTVGPELIPGSLHADNPRVTTRYNPLAKPGGVDDPYSPPVQLLLSQPLSITALWRVPNYTA